MVKRFLGIIILILPLLTIAQSQDSTLDQNGIHWTSGFTWEQVKQKAKVENKYIFIDAFATWCGPCKAMDNWVYNNDTVGELFNEKFISVKVQMDKTAKDDASIKKWYLDANSIKDKYHVEVFPTFIFLSPAGEIVDMAIGYKDVAGLISLAKAALVPGKVYNDPYAEYQILVSRYKQGIIDYGKIPYMARCALKLRELDFAVQLIKEHLKFAKTLSKEKRYSKENIQMWNSIGLGMETTIFKYFYEDGKMIDRVMQEKGYSENVIDKTIRNQLIIPFFEEQNKDTTIVMNGMYLTGGNLETSYGDADWEKLKYSISKVVNSYYTAKNLLWAKAEWYKRHRDHCEDSKYSLEYYQKYYTGNGQSLVLLNNRAWDAFEHCTDKKIIDGFITLLKKALVVHFDYVDMMDTYANLLYKAGRTKEAINWETKAATTAGIKNKNDQQKYFIEVTEKMKKGEPIPDVVWGYK